MQYQRDHIKPHLSFYVLVFPANGTNGLHMKVGRSLQLQSFFSDQLQV